MIGTELRYECAHERAFGSNVPEYRFVEGNGDFGWLLRRHARPLLRKDLPELSVSSFRASVLRRRAAKQLQDYRSR